MNNYFLHTDLPTHLFIQSFIHSVFYSVFLLIIHLVFHPYILLFIWDRGAQAKDRFVQDMRCGDSAPSSGRNVPPRPRRASLAPHHAPRRGVARSGLSSFTKHGLRFAGQFYNKMRSFAVWPFKLYESCHLENLLLKFCRLVTLTRVLRRLLFNLTF